MTETVIIPRSAEDEVARLGTVLTVWAHPDDEAFLAAGLLHLAVRGGARAVCVTATLGERGTPDPARWPPARLRALRRRELAASLGALGVSEERVLGFADGSLAAVDPGRGALAVAAVIHEVAPDTVVTFGPDGFTGHPDHRAVSRWTAAAFAVAAPAGSRLLYVTRTGEWWTRGPGAWADVLIDRDDPSLPVRARQQDLAVDLRLDGPTLDTKVAALLAHRSQTAGLLEALGPDRFRRWGEWEQFATAPAGTPTAPGTAPAPGVTRPSPQDR